MSDTSALLVKRSAHYWWRCPPLHCVTFVGISLFLSSIVLEGSLMLHVFKMSHLSIWPHYWWRCPPVDCVTFVGILIIHCSGRLFDVLCIQNVSYVKTVSFMTTMYPVDSVTFVDISLFFHPAFWGYLWCFKYSPHRICQDGYINDYDVPPSRVDCVTFVDIPLSLSFIPLGGSLMLHVLKTSHSSILPHYLWKFFW